ncbi:Rne/Rng family ribonuclease [Synechococcales cyanobacterium C]|uniref:Rne/Rng family ribonuclease n=1 Tax=Petrachloros mirabilis ULC683 TaxID=2781853 RepID=A0A8K2A0Y2_9CYAN|nr:Rne/Rng family ribonuclease [Petrachloros mirabilis]NCJ07741.1 Rne/Rng family ribonuclease [Petrachloros mirabilis ULC683]
MPKQIIIAEQHRIAAVFAEDQIQELIVATGSHQVSDIYLGVVENVLPGIDAAFVNIGDSEKNGFIHVSDLGPLRLKRSAGAITELLAPQQKVLVQVMKEPTGNKGPRLTGNVSLPGRYLVLMPSGRGVNLSRRIRNEEERSRLRALGILIKPAGMGLLVRTEAEDVAEEAILEDLELLQRQWESIQQQATSTRAPALLNRDDDFVQRVLRDVYSADVNRIVADSVTGVKRVKQNLMSWNANKLPPGVLVDQHQGASSILEYFRVNAVIREALKPRVDLPSGGYIIIERTEALTVIDVNSGSFTRSATARETVLWTNCEAATEIARQLRLRNIAGVIIVDFIDMDSRRDQLQVLEHFNKALKADKSRPQIAQLSELGLVELTRKRQGQNIYELFGRSCPTCGGLGHLVHLPGDADPAGEAVERVPARESVGSRPAATVASTFRAPLGLDPSEDLQELDLTNHPDYQERGNRRRRRPRVGEPTAKETVPPKFLRKNGKEQSPALPEPESNDTPRRRVIPDSGEKPKLADSLRSRDVTLPEVVTVAMSAEEQAVYAFLGISPLVLHAEAVKRPKSVVLNIVLPHEDNGSAVGSASLTDAPVDLQPPSESAETPVETPVETPIASEAEPLSELDEPEPETQASPPEVATHPAPNRRRRRRSSAAQDSEQLSLETDG